MSCFNQGFRESLPAKLTQEELVNRDMRAAIDAVRELLPIGSPTRNICASFASRLVARANEIDQELHDLTQEPGQPGKP